MNENSKYLTSICIEKLYISNKCLRNLCTYIWKWKMTLLILLFTTKNGNNS